MEREICRTREKAIDIMVKTNLNKLTGKPEKRKVKIESEKKEVKERW